MAAQRKDAERMGEVVCSLTIRGRNRRSQRRCYVVSMMRKDGKRKNREAYMNNELCYL